MGGETVGLAGGTFPVAIDIPSGCTGVRVFNTHATQYLSVGIGDKDFVETLRITALTRTYLAVGPYAGGASAVLNVDGVPTAPAQNDAITIGSITYLFRATISTATSNIIYVEREDGVDACLQYLEGAINGDTPIATKWSSNALSIHYSPHPSGVVATADTAADTLTLTWPSDVPGDTAQALDLVEAGAGGIALWDWDGGTAGGTGTLAARSLWLLGSGASTTATITRFYSH